MNWELIQGIELERQYDLIYMFRKIVLDAVKKIGRRWMTMEAGRHAKKQKRIMVGTGWFSGNTALWTELRFMLEIK